MIAHGLEIERSSGKANIWERWKRVEKVDGFDARKMA
jgi:hypothetical protein